MAATRILILGCGYTGRRVARLLVRQGLEVIGTSRTPETLRALGIVPVAFNLSQTTGWNALCEMLSPDTRVLYSLPSVGGADPTPLVLQALGSVARLVYLSTTGVYGRQREVDENTEPAPETPREWLRIRAEQAIASSAIDALILRPAAIYGPHRGIHASMRAGTYRLSVNGSNFVSRIHVDDLAAHCVAGLLSNVSGAWPVADEHPCTSAEIADYCANLLRVPIPKTVPDETLSETRRADRRVNGAAIRRKLNLQLRYPSYRDGIPACMEAEAGEAAEAAARAF